MIKEIKELNFPKYATLSQATVSLQDMGDKNITTQVQFGERVIPDFSYDWEIVFKGEKYIMPLRRPQGEKNSESQLTAIDLTFQHWAIYWLKKKYFFTLPEQATGSAVPDKYIASVSLNLGNFADLLSQMLDYHYGGKITVDLYSGWQYDSEPTTVEISYSYIWDVLIKLYELYKVRWTIEPNGDIDHYVIKIGYPSNEVSHIFEFGFEGGLMKLGQQVQDENICNVLMGRGGSKNLPYRYFKKHDEHNASFSADPDWIPELANIYFSELRGATFRSYIQGWRAAHIEQYRAEYPDEQWTLTVTRAENAYASWAWMRGYTDTKFNPVEFVADEYTTENNGYKVVPNSSIAKYGELQGALDNDEETYPTIQGIVDASLGAIDQCVAVEEILSDDIEEAAENDAKVKVLLGCELSAKLGKRSTSTQRVHSKGNFVVEDGMTANLNVVIEVVGVNVAGQRKPDLETAKKLVIIQSQSLMVYNAETNEMRSASGIPSGTWRYEISATIVNNNDFELTVTVADEEPILQSASETEQFSNTWDIWIKNIWKTQIKPFVETPQEYAERVWLPILGDRERNQAKIVFANGMLATSSDYEFTIVDVAYDNSKALDGVPSHWRLTLAKSDADLESTGVYIPSTKRFAEAGNRFFFVGIDMPHLYVAEAEKRLDDIKKSKLEETKEIKPTFVVELDKVRIHDSGKASAIVNNLILGSSLRIADKQFIPDVYETLYLQSITYTYNEATDTEANIIPDVDIVLSDSYVTTANPVEQINGEINAIQRQVGSIGNISQIVRTIGDKIYLRKDGIADRSFSPTEFGSLLTAMGFRQGMVGGKGWGFFQDENGNWVLETDRIAARQDIQANMFVVNQIEARGGMIVESAARIEVASVIKGNGYYICTFEQKRGSIANLFKVDDVAYSSRFTPDNAELSFYKRRVIGVTADSIMLSDNIDEVNGNGIPQKGDVIVHYGNYSDEERQYVKVRDVIGGGYERYIGELNSVNATGVEYYFVGKQNGDTPRWFIGDKNSQYAEYKDNKLTLNCQLEVSSTVGEQTLKEFVEENGGLNDAVRKYVDGAIADIQDQLDGVVETWFYDGEPTLGNLPASEWNTIELKQQHLGDLYYDNLTGKAYRFSQTGIRYYWNAIPDEGVAKALEAAQKAQDTADGKRRVFVETPYPPYDIGDLWVDGNDLRRCAVAKTAEQSYNGSDWVYATKYDNTKTVIDGGIVTSGTVQLAGDDTTIKAGITGSGTSADSVRMWAGATFTNRANAPFRVLQNGSVHATDAYVKGEINATKGKIGKLEIVNNYLSGFDEDGNELVRIGIGELPDVSSAFPMRKLSYQMDSEMPDVKIHYEDDVAFATRRVVWNDELIDDRNISCLCDFQIGKQLNRLEFEGMGLYVSAESGIVDVSTTQCYAELKHKVGSDWQIIATTYNQNHFLQGAVWEVPTPTQGQYRLEIFATVNFSTQQGSALAELSVREIMAYLAPSEASQKTTYIASDGILSIQGSNNYMLFSQKDGFEVRQGNVGFQVTSAGIKKLDKNTSQWVDL